jgi:predicted Holliday junction resolvase-like endonuclease
MEIFLIVIASGALALLMTIVLLLLRPYRVEVPEVKSLAQKLDSKLDSLATAASIKDIQGILEKLPKEVLKSITGSLSTKTGKLHELMATFELTHYDRLFYLGEPIDFVGIKYGEAVDFIEVKAGKSHLTEDEKKLKELIEAKQVNYVHLSVEKINIAEGVDVNRA